MKIPPTVTVSVILAGVTGEFAQALSHDVKTGIFGSQRNFDAFMSTNAITMERLKANPASSEIPYPREPDNLLSYRRQSPVRLSSEQVKELKNLLTRSSAYEWDATRACVPNYGVLLTVHSKPDIKIALCFECDMLAVYIGDKTKHGVNSVSSFDNISPQLFAIARGVYPKDSDLAKVEEPAR